MNDDRKVTLYHSPNTRSSGALTLLEELGVPYDLHVLNMKAGEQRRPEYLAINPKGRVRRVSAMRACAYARMRACARLDLTFWLSAAVIAD